MSQRPVSPALLRCRYGGGERRRCGTVHQHAHLPRSAGRHLRRVWRGNIHHARWPLQPAEADIVCNTTADQLKLKLAPRAPLLHFAQRLDVVAWPLEAVDAHL